MMLFDALFSAMKRKEILLTRYTRWYVYGAIIVMNAFLSSALLTSPPYKTYRIPAGSMLPTLDIGDRFIVQTTYYHDHPVQRGDVVVFPYPDDPSREFIKRVIGLPNETVEIVDKRVVIDGHPLQEAYIQHISEDVLPKRIVHETILDQLLCRQVRFSSSVIIEIAV